MDKEILEVTEITEEEALKLKQKFEETSDNKAEATLNDPGNIKTEKEAKGFINNCINYVKNGTFIEDVKNASKKTGIPEKKIARTFVQKTLATIGDGAIVVGNTVEQIVKTFLNILHYILTKAVEFIIKAAKFLFGLLTFGYTNVKETNTATA